MSARKGWIGDPQPERDIKPSHTLKWYRMMGAAHLLTARTDDSADLNEAPEEEGGHHGCQR